MKKLLTAILISILASTPMVCVAEVNAVGEDYGCTAVEAYSVQICSYDVLNGAWGPGVFNATTMFTSVEDLQAKIAEWEMLEAYDFSATTDECPKSFYDISNEYDDAL